MYGYEADFAHEGQIVMKLRRDPALRSNDMDVHSLKMIQRNRIPHILHADMQELDYDVTLVYEISGKRMLQQLMRSEQLSELQYYEWMLQLLRLLSNCREYMLNPNHLLLHEQFMFVEGGTQQGGLYVPYIPTHEALHAKAAIEGLRRLAVQLSGIVRQWTNDGFQQLLRKLHDDSQSIEQIQQFVQTMLVHAPPVQQPSIADKYNNEIAISSSEVAQQSQTEREHSQHCFPYSSSQLGTNSEQQRRLDMELQLQAESAASYGSHPASNRSHGVDWGFNDEKEDATHSPLVGAGIALLLGALGWKFGYMTTANTVNMLLSFAVTLIGVLFGFAWWRGWLHGMLNRSKGATAIHTHSAHSKNDASLPGFASNEPISQMKRAAAGMNGFSYLSDASKEPMAAAEMSRDASRINQTEPGGRKGAGVPSMTPSSYPSSKNALLASMGSMIGPSAAPYSAREESIPGAWGDARQENRSVNAVEQHYSHLAAHTSVLSSGPQDATVLLTSNPIESYQAKAGKLRIERLAKDGVTVAEEKTADEWPYVLGRAEQGAHYWLMETGVSKLHCELRKDAEGYTIQDLGSKNGTELNGELLIPYKTYQVEDGARIKLGHTILVLYHI